MLACKTCIGKLYVVHDSVNIEKIQLKTDDIFEAPSPVWKLDVCPFIGLNKVYNTGSRVRLYSLENWLCW